MGNVIQFRRGKISAATKALMKKSCLFWHKWELIAFEVFNHRVAVEGFECASCGKRKTIDHKVNIDGILCDLSKVSFAYAWKLLFMNRQVETVKDKGMRERQ